MVVVKASPAALLAQQVIAALVSGVDVGRVQGEESEIVGHLEPRAVVQQFAVEEQFDLHSRILAGLDAKFKVGRLVFAAFDDVKMGNVDERYVVRLFFRHVPHLKAIFFKGFRTEHLARQQAVNSSLLAALQTKMPESSACNLVMSSETSPKPNVVQLRIRSSGGPVDAVVVTFDLQSLLGSIWAFRWPLSAV